MTSEPSTDRIRVEAAAVGWWDGSSEYCVAVMNGRERRVESATTNRRRGFRRAAAERRPTGCETMTVCSGGPRTNAAPSSGQLPRRPPSTSQTPTSRLPRADARLTPDLIKPSLLAQADPLTHNGRWRPHRLAICLLLDRSTPGPSPSGTMRLIPPS
uniref:Uncharacterized protein n=1 Tax=Plectus sambesii TaxID=2011161 RepID=A0A914VEC7_9BILA